MNKKQIFHSFLPIIFLIFNSCSNKTRDNVKIIDKFSQTIELSGQPIPKIKNDFFPLQMGLKDSILVFQDFENSPHFHAYKVPGFDFIGSFGKKGKGPGELQNPSFWGQIEKNNNGRYTLWTYQMDLCQLVSLNIEKEINDPGTEFEKEFDIPLGPGEAVNIIAINDTSFVGTGAEAQGEFFIYDRLWENVEWKDYFVNSFINIEANRDVISECKRGIIKVKPDKSKFVKALVYAPIIDVYDSRGTLKFSIMLSDFKQPSIQANEFDGSTMVYYENIYVTDNYIYALNKNCTIDEYNFCDDAEIHVFTWNGAPVCNYKLNEGIGPASPFVVDELNNKIYTVNPKSEEDFFSLFDIRNSSSFN
jgi:hypothetical protein